MSEDPYAKPKLTKKVRFQKGEQEDGNTDVCDNIDNVKIYDNYWAEEGTPQDKSQDKAQDKAQDSITEDQQQTASVNVSSGKRNLLGVAAVFLGLMCLLLLVAVIVLVILVLLKGDRLWVDNANLTTERDELQTSFREMKSLNHNLTTERDELQTSFREMKSLNHNLTQKMSQLKNENNNITKDRDELQRQIERTSCPDNWIKFGNSCYLMSTLTKAWFGSKTACGNHKAQLVIISSKEEQTFISSFNQNIWIGLRRQNDWRWVDGTAVTIKYWGSGQNSDGSKNCASISKTSTTVNNWQALRCSYKSYFICEKILQ